MVTTYRINELHLIYMIGTVQNRELCSMEKHRDWRGTDRIVIYCNQLLMRDTLPRVITSRTYAIQFITDIPYAKSLLNVLPILISVSSDVGTF